MKNFLGRVLDSIFYLIVIACIIWLDRICIIIVIKYKEDSNTLDERNNNADDDEDNDRIL